MNKEILPVMEKRILTNFMDLIILSILRNNCLPLGGYDIIRILHREFSFLPNPGTVYSHLYSMERKGLLKSTENDRRRVYSLTQEGKKCIETLLANREYIERFFATAIFKNKPKDRFISVKAYKPHIQR